MRRLETEAGPLRADAQAYAQFRAKLGSIECEARKRADDLEIAASAKTRQAVQLFQSQYQALMESFEAAAGRVTGELRKIEVNLAQLPRTLDQTGAELQALAVRMDGQGREE